MTNIQWVWISVRVWTTTFPTLDSWLYKRFPLYQEVRSTLLSFKSEYRSSIGKAVNNITLNLMKSEAKDILAAVGVFASCKRKTILNLNLCIWPWSKSAKMSAFLLADF